MTRILLLMLVCMAGSVYAQTGNVAQRSERQVVYVLRLKPGQDLRLELERFAKAQKLQAAYVITCVGSLNEAALRMANEPDYQKLAGKFEIVSLVGTLAQDGSHLHLSVSDRTGRTLGGHLGEGSLIYTTAEIVLGEAADLRFTREKDVTYGYQELAVKRRSSRTKRR